MLISFEGIEGSGKSTQIVLLVSALEALGHSCIATREPGSTAIGERIRAILLDARNHTMTAATELLLYEADRAQHIHEIVKPALAADKIVITDRFFDATTVYQGYARGFDLNVIARLHEIVVGPLKPDLTLLLDLPAPEGLARAWRRISGRPQERSGEDRFEREALSFHERVREGYLNLAQAEPERFRVINGGRPSSEVHQEILKVVLGCMEGRRDLE